MTPDRWRRVEELYHAAQACAPEAQAAFLDEACGDVALRRDVEALLAQRASADSFLAQPAVVAAAPLISNPAGSVVIGRVVGSYRIDAGIGAGGMGEVYRARDLKFGRDVAIKIFPDSPRVKWSADDKALFVSTGYATDPGGGTVVLPWRGADTVPANVIFAPADLPKRPGARVLSESSVAPGPTDQRYAFARPAERSNLYRIRVP